MVIGIEIDDPTSEASRRVKTDKNLNQKSYLGVRNAANHSFKHRRSRNDMCSRVAARDQDMFNCGETSLLGSLIGVEPLKLLWNDVVESHIHI